MFVSDFVTGCSTQVVNRLWSVLRLLLGNDLGYSSIASCIAVYSKLAGTELNDALRDDKFPVLFVLLSKNLDVPYYRRDVPAGQTMTKRGALYVNSQDTTSLVVTFISRELPQVTATKDF